MPERVRSDRFSTISGFTSHSDSYSDEAELDLKRVTAAGLLNTRSAIETAVRTSCGIRNRAAAAGARDVVM